jgi:ABC-type antimicrobial peptide transport system permease subunit
MGLYGLMSYSVARRTQEIGVRMALGAGRIHVMRMVMGQMLKLVIAGLVIGLAGSIIANQTIRRSIYGVTLYDPLTIAAVIVTLLAVTLIAGYQPLRRASKIDPTVALRCE